jgi:hypothetical protein
MSVSNNTFSPSSCNFPTIKYSYASHLPVENRCVEFNKLVSDINTSNQSIGRQINEIKIVGDLRKECLYIGSCAALALVALTAAIVAFPILLGSCSALGIGSLTWSMMVSVDIMGWVGLMIGGSEVSRRDNRLRQLGSLSDNEAARDQKLAQLKEFVIKHNMAEVTAQLAEYLSQNPNELTPAVEENLTKVGAALEWLVGDKLQS